MRAVATRPQVWRQVVVTDLAILIMLAVARVLLHTLLNGQYGFHRDELGMLDNARYLDWGYVEYPPLAPWLTRLGLTLFGTSLVMFLSVVRIRIIYWPWLYKLLRPFRPLEGWVYRKLRAPQPRPGPPGNSPLSKA